MKFLSHVEKDWKLERCIMLHLKQLNARTYSCISIFIIPKFLAQCKAGQQRAFIIFNKTTPTAAANAAIGLSIVTIFNYRCLSVGLL
jgi:hypothetical protein